ncbi:MAG TPA: 50S ribosomal protein L9 [Dehalococcoidia bacterium]|nr:50S ribosomal protein L9 [Dehalococcoidia bacterium]
MKVVFLEDVADVAKSGDVKEAADGYARNFLIPRGLAALTTSQVTSQLEFQLASQSKKQARAAEKLAAMAKQLNGSEITLKAKVGAKDRLYGSITSADIAKELTRTSGITIDKRKIELSEPIRELGIFEVAIKLGKDALPKIKVTVEGQESG